MVARFEEYARTRDRRLRDELVTSYLSLSDAMARRFARRGEPIDDLRQIAAVGLVKAVERFDPGYGARFTTFAVPTILGEIRRHFRDRGWTVRVPRRVQELRTRLDSIVSTLSQELGRSPTTAEIARSAGVREEDVLEALEAPNYYRPASLEGDHFGSGRLRGRVLMDGLPAAESEMDDAEDRLAIQALLSRLPEREREILRLRYFENLSQSAIAERVGISQMHVSRLIRHSLELLLALDRRPT